MVYFPRKWIFTTQNTILYSEIIENASQNRIIEYSQQTRARQMCAQMLIERKSGNSVRYFFFF